MKSFVDRYKNEMASIRNDFTKLEDKGYPEQMITWCEGKVKDMEASVDVANKVYLNEAANTCPPDAELESINERTRVLEAAIAELDAKYCDWKKTAGSEIKKITS